MKIVKILSEQLIFKEINPSKQSKLKFLTIIKISDPINLHTKDFKNKIKPYLQNKTLCFIDGPIGAGKSTTIEYLEKNLSSVKIFLQPINQIREITKDYYKNKKSVEETNKKIGEICTNEWMKYLKSTDLDKISNHVIIEQLPPPFRYWIFEKPFNLNDKQKLNESLISNQKNFSNIFNIFIKTIQSFEEVIHEFNNLLIIITIPSLQIIMNNIHDRSSVRPEEKVLESEYINYLISKFNLFFDTMKNYE